MVSDEIQSMRGSGRFICGLQKADFLSYVRCKCNMAHHTLQEYRLWTHSDDIIVNEGLLKQETLRWNNLVKDQFNISPQLDGFVADPGTIIQYLIKSHNKEQNMRKQLNLPCSDPVNDIKLKICMDGRKIGGTKSVVFSIVPLNLSTF